MCSSHLVHAYADYMLEYRAHARFTAAGGGSSGTAAGGIIAFEKHLKSSLTLKKTK